MMIIIISQNEPLGKMLPLMAARWISQALLQALP